MLMFEQCLSNKKLDLELFWNSPRANISPCLRLYGFNVFPLIFCAIIFLIDFFVNKSLSKKNRFKDYFKTYFIRFFVQILLIGSCIFELYISIKDLISSNNIELSQLTIAISISKLMIYLILQLFDLLHFMKNIGISCFSSIVVTIDWSTKAYLLFEIAYINRSSYSTYDLVLIVIQTVCLSILLISYVFLPNLIIISGENLNLLNSKKKRNLISDSNKFSISKRSLFSQIIFGYFDGYVFYGYKHKYNLDNILPLENELTVNSVLNDYETNYKEKYLKDSKFENNYNILKLVLKLYRNFFLFNLFLFLIQLILAQLDPQIIYQLIAFIQQPNDIRWHGYFFTFLLCASQLSRVIIVGIFNRNMNYLQARMQILLVNHIYKKALKRSMLKDKEPFDLYNLMTVDVNNILNSCYFCFDLVSIPLSTILAIIFLYQQIGVSIFYALLTFVPIVVPVTYFITLKTKRAQKRTMKAKDIRLKLLSDLLNGIRSVKLNYWDPIFNSKVSNARKEEMNHFKKYQLFYGISDINFHIFPVVLSMLSFVFYLSIDDKNVLTPEKAFTVLNYFGILKVALTIIPRSLHLLVTSLVSGKRIQNFLKSKEKDEYITREFDIRYAVQIEKNVSFSWQDADDSKSNEYALKNLNIKIKKGNLVALVSKNVASGRSSFLSCLLGEMRMIKEKPNQKVNISKDMQIALVGSKPWIEMKSIKENILFGMPFNQQKYNYALDQCLIREELIKFEKADDHVMGKDTSDELKQKVSLARAYYSDANLILLDDFLNQFNDYSAKIMFDRIINPNKNSLFKNKTCIMVLNCTEYLKYFDQILVFNNGEIRSENDFDELQKNQNFTASSNADESIHPKETFKRSISSKLYNFDNLNSSLEKNTYHDEKNCFNCARKLIDDEEEVTHFGWSVYKRYFSTWRAHWLILMTLAYFLSIVFGVVQSDWLSKWSNNSGNLTGNALKQYNQDGLTKYVIYALLISFFYGAAMVCYVYGSINSAINFHKLLLKKILSLPLFFFDKTPIGSIVNRFSKDMDTIDHVLPTFLKLIIYIGFQIMSVFFVIISNFPLSVILIAIMMIVYCFLFKIFLKTIIDVKRLELQTRTVLYMRFEELSSGLPVILAYSKTKLFTQNLNQKLETNIKSNVMLYIAFKWLALRNEMIGITILIGASLLSIVNSDTIDGGSAAMVLNFAVQLTGLLMALIGILASFIIDFVSVDRICQYLNLEEEEDFFNNSPAPDNWPNKGKIEFDNFSCAYTECREPVLEDVDLKIDENSLIALVGRGGSGKTSLALSLFNSMKPLNGKILIDDVDVTKIGLQQLRKSLSIFTQETALFTGTIYFNLDPEGQYRDSELWTVLDYVGLKDQILYLPGNLHYELNDGGSNLSLSQKQLLCLARCMLKNSKVMIIDEINCNFDPEIETRLRQLYKTVFKDRTIILITKNLDNIMASDKVLFLNQGHVQNYETPSQIFDEKNFSSNVIDALNNNNELLDVLNNNNE